ncbi:MAG: type I 3-dehydroquinate dehydratase [Deltaproteobacteria bacterium]|nr:type I 3-dehydroquinate dehydratase [Deltaproteobacteria bacterium]
MKIGKLEVGNRPNIAAVIIDGEDKKAIAQAKRNGADLLELRIDCFKKQDVAAVQKTVRHIQAQKLPLLATIRSKAEGGKSGISEKERLRLFQNIMPFVDAVDIELGSKKILKHVIKAAHESNKKAIISYHNFKSTPEQKRLEAIVKNCKKAGGDIVKIAAFAREKKDIVRLASLVVSHKDIIIIAMGKLGIASRLFFPMLGSLITYCSVTESSAPGQLSLKTTAKLLKELRK